jgi:hypothetical protein
MFNMRRGIYSGRPKVPGHKYWRLNITGTLDPQAAGTKVASFAELQMRQVAGVANTMSTLGVATDSTHFSTVYDAPKAIDGNVTTGWITGSGLWNGAKWIMTFNGNQVVKQIMMQAWSTSASAAQMPSSFDVQWSDDNLAWTTAVSITGQTAWAVNEQRLFAVP